MLSHPSYVRHLPVLEKSPDELGRQRPRIAHRDPCLYCCPSGLRRHAGKSCLHRSGARSSSAPLSAIICHPCQFWISRSRYWTGKIRTTLRTRTNAESPGTKARQSFTWYGLAMTTASATTMLVPSHLAGIVRLNASNRSCASRVTPLPRRASRSWIFATVELSRAFNARISRGWSGG